ncbi:MAG TPA: sulfatase [Thermoanaerobaculia bacterium]|nr:sulfatase [Thermoanaerobaculia bacterium]
MRRSTPYRRLAISLASLGACATLALLPAGCHWGPPVHKGPIVLITIDALRADTVGALGGPPKVMPALSGLAQQADYAGRAISPSSWTVPSMAALFTGFQPWRAQSWSADGAKLDDRFVTLPESLKKLGYKTAAFRSNHWLAKPFGYSQGFDSFQDLREGKGAVNYLEQLKGDRELVWIHILQPHAPYVRRDPLLDRLDDVPPDLPRQVKPLDLEPYADPAVPLPADEERRLRALYKLNAAYADTVLARLLKALERSGQWDKTLLVVTSDHGEEFKENGQIAHGGNLGHVLVEVPLVIKLPKGFDRKIEIPPGRRVANVRVAPTLIEAAGGTPERYAAPSFFQPFDKGALSELYLGNAVNRFSLVEGDLQLLWESHFGKPEADYFRARYAGIGGQPQPPLTEPADAIFQRLHQQFSTVLPLTGLPAEPPQLTLWKWTPQGTEKVEDPQALQRMTRQLKNAWLAANGQEVAPGRSVGKQPQLTPQQEEELRSLGYVAGGKR